jgi:hypothetical protein
MKRSEQGQETTQSRAPEPRQLQEQMPNACQFHERKKKKEKKEM